MLALISGDMPQTKGRRRMLANLSPKCAKRGKQLTPHFPGEIACGAAFGEDEGSFASYLCSNVATSSPPFAGR